MYFLFVLILIKSKTFLMCLKSMIHLKTPFTGRYYFGHDTVFDVSGTQSANLGIAFQAFLKLRI